MSQSSSDEDYETLGKHYLAFINFLLYVLFIFHPFNKVLLKSCFILIGLWPSADQLRKYPELRQMVNDFFAADVQDIQLHQDIVWKVYLLNKAEKKNMENAQNK